MVTGMGSLMTDIQVSVMVRGMRRMVTDIQAAGV
jgi:hypothetical protein